MRQFHKSQKMDVIFVGLKNNIFYKSLIISIICFTYSLNSYVVTRQKFGWGHHIFYRRNIVKVC